MSSGRIHDLSGFTVLPLTLAASIVTQDMNVLIVLNMGVALGFSHFSPDLDMVKSNPTRRWSIFKYLWTPYRKVFPHKGKFINRNFWTHAPLLGTAIRLGYFALLVSPLVVYFDALRVLQAMHLEYFMVGVEIASLTHLFLDVRSTLIHGTD